MTGRNPPRPVYVVNLGEVSLNPYIEPRLIELTITDERGIEADQLDLTVDDSDGKLDIPRRGTYISVAIGFDGELLQHKGVFVIDDVEHGGAPDRLTVRGRSADLRKTLTEKRDESWHDTTVGEIVTTIATRNELTPAINEVLAAAHVAHIDQTDESDINFIDRIARQFDAIATVKNTRLLFIPVGGGVSLTGQAMGRVTIVRSSGDSHRFSVSDREAYTGVRAYWYDSDDADQQEVLVGKEEGRASSSTSASENEEENRDHTFEPSASKIKTLRHTYPNQISAERAARADWQRLQRGLAEFTINLVKGRPDIVPEQPVTVSGFNRQIDGGDWIVKRITHRLNDSGLTSAIELEIKMEFGKIS